MRVPLLLVFGAAGTLARYALQGIVQHRSDPGFPTGTLAVNLVGCFLLGGVAQFSLNHLGVSPDWRVALTIGFFGAFTTFSSFSWETIHMLEDGEWGRAAVYVLSSVLGGLLLVRIGMKIGDAL